MKRYWPFMGAVGVAATIGLYAYVNRDPLYEEPETEEEYLEEGSEYEAELPEEEIPAPYTTKNTKEKDQTQRKQKQNKYDQKENKSNPYNRSSPKPSGLEETLEDEERLWYDLPTEKREFQSWEELGKYVNAALEAHDYKVAESYMQYAEKFVEPKTPENYKDQKKAMSYVIISRYNEYLNEVITNCRNQSYESIFRKVMWMNFFATEHDQIFPIYDPETEKNLDLVSLFEKGNEALDSLKYCHE